MRNKAKEDPTFRERLLNYITQVVEECMPEEPLLDEDADDARLFQAYPHPDDPNFNCLMRHNLSTIVRYRQMHCHQHMPTCFKYRSKKCRPRFPRAIISETSFDEDTGVIRVKTRSSLSQQLPQVDRSDDAHQPRRPIPFHEKSRAGGHHYVMKYITKAEVALHSNLTIAAPVRKALAPSSMEDVGKKMLLKIYNKMESYKEVGVPEAITHMLEYPDHYTDATFCNLHTTHLLAYMKRLEGRRRTSDDAADNRHDSDIIVDDRGGFSLVSLFDDYADRGESLSEYCLYDYGGLIYKVKGKSGISYKSHHPQHSSHRQVVPKSSAAIPTLLGRLLFLNKDSEKDSDREDYYCLLTSLFFPWSCRRLVKPHDISLEEFFHCNTPTLTLRLWRHIANIDLLNKTKEEMRLDRLQRRAQEAEPGDNDNDNDSLIFDDNRIDINIANATWNNTPNLSLIDQAIEFLMELDSNYYVREGVDASDVNGYLRPSTSDDMREDEEVHYSSLPENYVMDSLLSLSTSAAALMSDSSPIVTDRRDDPDIQPSVHFTDGREDDLAIHRIVDRFTLNAEQERAFRIVADHSLGKSAVGQQLLMGLFGEAGTGKSRVVDAVRAWFATLDRSKELIVTATTGTAAFNINGSTLHSALGIPVERCDIAHKMSRKKKSEWADRRYLIVDEVSMMDCKLVIKLHDRLYSAKSTKDDIKFGGVNIVFFGNFLQLPSVSPFRLYMDTPRYQQGHHLWRSLNAVVILRTQVRQAGDRRYADLLRRLRIRQPTAEDLELLNSRVGAALPDSATVTFVVRRDELRHALNLKRLHSISESTGTPVTYCVTRERSRIGISHSQVYALRVGHKNVKGDAILPLIYGAPLMVT